MNQTTCPPGAAGPPARSRCVFPVHPALFAAFPLLTLYARNIHEVSLRQIGRPLGLALLGTTVMLVLFLLLTRHLRKAALAASAFVLVFFSYGHVLNLLPSSFRGVLPPGCAAVLALMLAVVLRTRQPLHDTTVILNIVASVLIAPSCWVIGSSVLQARPDPGEARDTLIPHRISARVRLTTKELPAEAVRHKRLPSTVTRNLPDVYYIVLDAYGRSDSLRRFYGYDNEPFLRELEKRGFYIARRSWSNYGKTQLSVASALNMEYLDGLTGRLGRAEESTEPLRQMLDDNAVIAWLRKRGYRYVYIGTGAEQTRVETADTKLNSGTGVSVLEEQMLGLTALDAAPGARSGLYEQHRAYLLGGFRHLETVARLPDPKFVFAHILAPHPPFVFGPNGEAVHADRPFNFDDGSWLLRQITREEYRRGYVAQLQYVNRRVLEAVDAILRQSRRPPLIVLQGDHGPRLNRDWDSLERTDVREAYSILNAYYVPERVRQGLYPGITPVNTFRVLLARVFGLKQPLLADRSFASPVERPYDFTEVTGRISETPDAVSPAPVAGGTRFPGSPGNKPVPSRHQAGPGVVYTHGQSRKPGISTGRTPPRRDGELGRPARCPNDRKAKT